MNKKRAAMLLTCLLMLLAVLPAPESSAVEYDPILKIGLFYGVNALPSANLQNVTGHTTGYEAGYYDSTSREFYSLFRTDEIYLTVLKDKPMWVNESNVYFDVQPSSYKYSIGCYHIEAEAAFDSYGSAMELVTYFINIGYKAFPAYVSGTYRVRVGEHLTKELAEGALVTTSAATGYSFKVVGGSTTCYTITVTGTDRILFEFDSGGMPMGIRPNSRQTWFKGNTYYGGFEYNRINGNDITVINIVQMNDYIKGVVPYEVNSSWHIEAQKAQAVCAKCYTVNNMNKHRSQGFDLCNTTDCQVYQGTKWATSVTDAAVDSTYGIYAIYDGKIAQTYYHSTSGGYTDDVANIWGSAVPYLLGVEDKYLKVLNPYSFSVSLSDITAILQSKGYTSKNITDYYVSRYSQYGNVIEVAFVEAGGNVLRFSGDKARTVLNNSNKNVFIGSHRYTVSSGAAFYINGQRVTKSLQSTYAIGAGGTVSQVTVDNSSVRAITKSGVETVTMETSSSVYTVSGTGLGHNIGMSQWGAHGMAEAGFTYDQIIKYFFTGVQVGHFQ